MFGQITLLMKAIILCLWTIFLAQQFLTHWAGVSLVGLWGLSPEAWSQPLSYWKSLTYAWVHPHFFHLLFNSMLLAWTGSALQKRLGLPLLLGLYGVCSLTELFGYPFLSWLLPSGFSLGAPLVGLDGFLYGLLGLYALLFGNQTLVFLWVLPLKAKHFLFFWMGFEGLLQLAQRTHLAATLTHFLCAFTCLLGLGAWLFWKKNRGAPPQGRSLASGRRSSLRLVTSEEEPKTWH